MEKRLPNEWNLHQQNQQRHKKKMKHLFPDPEGPTIASDFPAGTRKETFLRMSLLSSIG
jgi:hypothetical protein